MAPSPLLAPDDLLATGDAPLRVGLSGGLDSVVLLHALAALPQARRRDLRAIHIHHGLHPDADLWQRHCEQVCAQWQVPLQCVRVVVEREAGHGLEAAARHARHAAFVAAMAEGDVLALAHHRDDQAETFLLRALRGSGVDGLGAMRPWRAFGPGWLWRPLLERPRDQLQAYAIGHELRWIDDPSNADPAFDRNFLRQQVMPLLRSRWPHADQALSRAAGLCAQAGQLLAGEDTLALAGTRTADARVLQRTALARLSPERRARVLRQWIAELGLPPLPAEGIARIETELLHARADADPQFAWQDAVVRAWRDLLHADRARMPLPHDWQRHWDGATALALPDGASLRLSGADRFAAPLRVHARRGGERIHLPGRRHTHALKQVLQDLGVPPWTRESLPLLSSDDAVQAVADLAYAAEFDAWLRARGARLVWTPPGG